MSTNTPQQAVAYYLKNSENIDPAELIRNMAIHEPQEFAAFLAEVTQLSTNKLAGRLAKLHPDTFMRRAGFENRHNEAAGYIVHELKRPGNVGKVPAIKKTRETWGLGLFDAKIVIDTVQFEMQKLMVLTGANGEDKHHLLGDEHTKAYTKIMEAALWNLTN